MSGDQTRRFQVVVEEGPPHGDLYELEQTTYYHVVDTHSGEVVMTFEGELQASLSRDTGMWDDYACSGVNGVAIAPDGESVIVRGCDGREEVVSLPRQP
jgi:hypothetical protein